MQSYNDHLYQTDLGQWSPHTLTDSIPPRPSDVAAAPSGFPSLYGVLGDELTSTVVILGVKNGCETSSINYEKCSCN